jgi:uncharacterized protein with PQ loop repeat
MLVETICGYVGTAGLICLLLPQLYHVYRTKDASGTAWGFIGLQYVVSVNYIVYGTAIDATPIVISNACNLVSVVGITACKLIYTTPPASQKNDDMDDIHPRPSDGRYGSIEV